MTTVELAPHPTRRCGRCGIVDAVEEFRLGSTVCERCRREIREARRRQLLGDRPRRRPAHRPPAEVEPMLQDLIAYRLEHGQWPSSRMWKFDRPAGTRSSSAYYNHFGAWPQAIRAAERRMERGS
jgi:hypothetical protein